jgi:hypothetical protein
MADTGVIRIIRYFELRRWLSILLHCRDVEVLNKPTVHIERYPVSTFCELGARHRGFYYVAHSLKALTSLPLARTAVVWINLIVMFLPLR